MTGLPRRFAGGVAATATLLAILFWAYHTRGATAAPGPSTQLESLGVMLMTFAAPVGASIALLLPAHALGRLALPVSALPIFLFTLATGSPRHPLGLLQPTILTIMLVASIAWAIRPSSRKTVWGVRLAYGAYSLGYIALWLVIVGLSAPVSVMLAAGLLLAPPVALALGIERVSAGEDLSGAQDESAPA